MESGISCFYVIAKIIMPSTTTYESMFSLYLVNYYISDILTYMQNIIVSYVNLLNKTLISLQTFTFSPISYCFCMTHSCLHYCLILIKLLCCFIFLVI